MSYTSYILPVHLRRLSTAFLSCGENRVADETSLDWETGATLQRSPGWSEKTLCIMGFLQHVHAQRVCIGTPK